MPQEGTVNIINETGSFIWQLCDGHNSPANIARKISGEFQVAKQAAGADVKEFIRGLSEKGMIIS